MGLIFSLAQKGCVSLSFLSGDFMKYKNLGRSFFSSLLRMSFSIFLQYEITFILSVHFWLNENGKVNPVPVTSFCLEVDVFQQIHSTTNEKTNPIWVLGWQNRN